MASLLITEEINNNDISLLFNDPLISGKYSNVLTYLRHPKTGIHSFTRYTYKNAL